MNRLILICACLAWLAAPPFTAQARCECPVHFPPSFQDPVADDEPSDTSYVTTPIEFKSHDGFDMFGKLTLPRTGKPRAIVIYVQTAEGSTVDMKRRGRDNSTFLYYDIYRKNLAQLQIGFFSYEGRGVRMGDAPPRYEVIDWDIYNTSSLENKVRDAMSAIAAVKQQAEGAAVPIWLIGASEGTLLCAETAARSPDQVSGLVLYGVLASNMRENFRFIMSDGAYLAYRQFFDTNQDGRIDREEFEADPKKYRERALRNAAFSTFDRNADDVFSADEMKLVTKTYLDAIDNENFALLQMWAKFNAAVAVPNDWFKDHFAHEPIWTYLKDLDIPVGCFHGALDSNTPIAAVKQLETWAKESGKSRMEFQYFDDGDHSLNVIQYFLKGDMPAAHGAIFSFLDRHIPQN